MTLDPVKISEKSALTAADSAAGDRFPVVDVSAGQLKTMTRAELATAVGGSSAVTADRALVSNGSGAVAASDVTATELGRLSGVTSGVQTQLAGKQAANDNLTALAGVTGAADRVPYFTALATLALAVLTSFGRSLIAAADAAGVRSLLGLGTAAQSNTGDFAAASHTHAAADISDSTSAGRAVLTAADAAAQRTALGLGTSAVEAATAFPTLAPATSARNEIVPTANDALAQRHKQKSGGQTTLYELQRSDGTKAITLATDGIYFWNLDGTIIVAKLNDLGVPGWAAFTANKGFQNGTDGARYWRDAALNLVSGDLLKWGAAFGAADTGLGRNAAGVVEVNNGTDGTFRDLAARHLLSSDFLRLTGNITNNSTTPTNVTGLTQTLTAGKKYAGRLVLIVSCPAPGDGVTVDFDGGTATFNSACFGVTGCTPAMIAGFTVSTTANIADDLVCTGLSDTNPHFIIIDVTLHANAGGTFIPRVGKASDSAGDELSVLDGSYFDLREVR